MRLRWLGVVTLALVVQSCSDPSASTGSQEATPAVAVAISAAAEAAAEEVSVDLADSVHQAIAEISAHLDLPRASIRVDVAGEHAVPEVGVGGFTDPQTGAVSLAVDPAAPRLAWTLTVALPVTLAHELHHAARILDGPGYGRSLEEAIVTEGLADAFSAQVFPAAPASTHPWSRAPSTESPCRWWSRAQGEPDSPAYDHGAWFFGTSDAIPRWTGYQLGTGVVAAYLSRHPGTTAAELADVDAMTIMEGSEFCASGANGPTS